MDSDAAARLNDAAYAPDARPTKRPLTERLAELPREVVSG
jgi:uncharacterized glyoxalase superfamily protein PhnB